MKNNKTKDMDKIFIYSEINKIIEEEKIVSLETLATELTKRLFKYKRFTYDENHILRHNIINQKDILKKKYEIKSIGLEEAIKIVYPKEKFELFVNPHFPKYDSSFHLSFVWTDNTFFYKKEEDLKSYIKFHTEPKKINALRWVS